jgi:predicted glycosyltransferase
MDLITNVLELYGFKTIEVGNNKTCLEKKIMSGKRFRESWFDFDIP